MAKAFSQFYTEEHDAQVRRAYLLLGTSPLAHDVVADAFISVLQRWDTIDQPGSYLNRCVLNGCRDANRTSQQERPLDPCSAERSTTDPVVEMAELLLCLPFRQRAAIVLRFYGGFTENEISLSLDCKPGTVGSLIHRGLQSLRQALSSETNND